MSNEDAFRKIAQLYTEEYGKQLLEQAEEPSSIEDERSIKEIDRRILKKETVKKRRNINYGTIITVAACAILVSIFAFLALPRFSSGSDTTKAGNKTEGSNASPSGDSEEPSSVTDTEDSDNFGGSDSTDSAANEPDNIVNEPPAPLPQGIVIVDSVQTEQMVTEHYITSNEESIICETYFDADYLRDGLINPMEPPTNMEPEHVNGMGEVYSSYSNDENYKCYSKNGVIYYFFYETDEESVLDLMDYLAQTQ